MTPVTPAFKVRIDNRGLVNSGIYIINEYRLFLRDGRLGRLPAVRVYVKAYSHKVVPVMLTVMSTVLGLVPFFFDGDKEPFWFSFATGVTGGLLFSIPAIVLVMPLFLRLKHRQVMAKKERMQVV